MPEEQKPWNESSAPPPSPVGIARFLAFSLFVFPLFISFAVFYWSGIERGDDSSAWVNWSGLIALVGSLLWPVAALRAREGTKQSAALFAVASLLFALPITAGETYYLAFVALSILFAGLCVRGSTWR